MSTLTPQQPWEENIILADADWMDQFIFQLTVNFERMLERPLPKAPLDRWIDYLALDGGLRPGTNRTQVLFIYSAERNVLKNCMPSGLDTELDGKAFQDNLGEFLLSSFPAETALTDKGPFFAQSIRELLTVPQVKRLLLVPDMENYELEVKNALRDAGDRNVTLFAPEPLPNCHCKQEILTYSAMAALGIQGKELP